MRCHRAMLMAPLGLLTLASCGGSPSPTLSQPQFVARANAICTSSSASSAAVPQPSVSNVLSPAPSDMPAIAAYLSKEVAVLQTTVNRLKALGTPPSKQSAWSQALAAIQHSVDDAKAAQSAAKAGNASAYDQALGRIVDDGASIDQTFGSFGANACTSAGASASPSP